MGTIKHLLHTARATTSISFVRQDHATLRFDPKD